MSKHIMTTRLTAEDFANAAFAELPKYGIRAHKSAGNSFWQRDGITRATDEEMADAGWVPAPDQAPGRTITQSDYQKIIDETSVPYGAGFTDGFHQAGGSIIDDPKPTNAEQIIDLMGLAPANLNRRDLAVWLDKAGVRLVTESE